MTKHRLNRRDFLRFAGLTGLGLSTGLNRFALSAQSDTLPPPVDTTAAVEAAMTQVEDVLDDGRFQPTWESLRQYVVPDWYQDAKFGIFIHWGVYSVPAFGNEWYPRNMYTTRSPERIHHITTYGETTEFGYKDFIPMFRAENFDATAWADLFKRAGARYVVPVAEHHDGFAMYDSSFTRWNAVDMGPQRDVVGELAEAVRAEGLAFGVSNHSAEHWWFMNPGMETESDVQDPEYADLYGPAMPGPRLGDWNAWNRRDWTPAPHAAYLETWLARMVELVDKYQPDLFWFDWWIEQYVFESYIKQFAAYYYNRADDWDKGVAINYKHEAFPEGTAVYDIERGQLEGINPNFWQTDTAVGTRSWGYIEGEVYKPVERLIGDLIDIVSKNGTLLLNIGPRADGTIPQEQQDILLGMGDWLAINGDAIYGTRPWHIFGEGPTQIVEGSFNDTARRPFTGQDIRFTTNGDDLYAIFLAAPGAQGVIESLGTDAPHGNVEIDSVTLLGYDGDLTWSHNADALVVDMPDELPGAYAFALKITTHG